MSENDTDTPADNFRSSNETSQFRLLGENRFAPFFWTQFLGALNDNLFKFAFTVLATFSAADWGGLDPQSAGAVIGGVFILPFVLFSAVAGQWADKWEKSRLIRVVKNAEVLIMCLVAAGFYWQLPVLLFSGVFLMGLQSTLFGPVKYAYLPQHLNNEELTGGNGLVEMGTFVAILLGTIAGGLLVGIGEQGPVYVALVSILIALAGRVAAGIIPQSPAPQPDLSIELNPFSQTWDTLKSAYANRVLFLAMLGISWLWFFGSIFLTSFAGFAQANLGGDEQVVALLLTLFSVGIGLGSLACERLSARRVEIGLVPFGSIGMSLFGIDLYFASNGLQPEAIVGIGAFVEQGVHWRVMFDLFGLSLFAGFYSVPLYSLIQLRADPKQRARIIAANNILNALFMVGASVMAAGLIAAGLSLPELFLVTAILNAAVALFIYRQVPEFLVRFIIWILIHSFYRLRKYGVENIPRNGPCVLVCNHVSFVDALVIMAACPRPIRFVMHHQIFKWPVLSFVFREVRAIPIASARDDKALMERAFEQVAETLEARQIVAIFPEGRITDHGELNPFKPGISRILKTTPVPVVPMALRGLWGSFFSRKDAPAMTKPFRRGLFNRISIVIDKPIPAEQATPAKLQERVGELRGENR